MSAAPIQTPFRGVLYRSRTEARWASFFHALNIEARYEAEGFVLPNGAKYLPDFFISKFPLYIEVKPMAPTAAERRKAFWLFDLTKVPVLIVIGEPSSRQGEIFNSFFDGELGRPSNTFFGGCRRCDQVAIAYEWGSVAHGYEPLGGCSNPLRCGDRDSSQEVDKISAAIDRCRDERFGFYPAA